MGQGLSGAGLCSTHGKLKRTPKEILWKKSMKKSLRATFFWIKGLLVFENRVTNHQELAHCGGDGDKLGLAGVELAFVVAVKWIDLVANDVEHRHEELVSHDAAAFFLQAGFALLRFAGFVDRWIHPKEGDDLFGI